MLQRCDAIIRFLCKDYKHEHKVEKHDKEYWLNLAWRSRSSDSVVDLFEHFTLSFFFFLEWDNLAEKSI